MKNAEEIKEWFIKNRPFPQSPKAAQEKADEFIKWLERNP